MALLSERIVVVTGGARGLGRAVAVGAAASGASVLVADYGVDLDGDKPSAAAGEEVAQEIRSRDGDAHAVNATVATMDGAKEIVAVAKERWGRIDGLVCCAGILRHRPFLEMTEHDWDSVIGVHLKGHFTMFRTVGELMAQQGSGSIVGFSSGYLSGYPNRANYRAAKAGVVALSKCAAIDLAPVGIRVNCIAPAANTRMTGASDVHIEQGDPDYVSPLVNYLLSDLSSAISGQIFSVAGPRIAGWCDPFENRMIDRPNGTWTPEDLVAEIPYLTNSEETGMNRLSARQSTPAPNLSIR